ncbi:hypothetical protein RchiOBHm_Chr7g0223621 [Rosa chinensis]|uniref:Uncharacterized protein n=1 Tax=Rosa chinensis TaxID=74649 RepID=A0A2P6PDL8_ROSCH|nr:hypothetical protein RchiOBHm_Chr7g0223621 [Rosa chinensis]
MECESLVLINGYVGCLIYVNLPRLLIFIWALFVRCLSVILYWYLLFVLYIN